MEYGLVSEDKEFLRQLILDKGLKWGEGIYPNLETPKWLFDLREVILAPDGLALASCLIYERIKNLEFDAIGGPSIAAEPLVAALISRFAANGRDIEGFVARKEANNFGLRKIVEGPIKNGSRIILVDDILNSGSSIISSINSLSQLGCDIVKIVFLVDFGKSGSRRLLDLGYQFESVFGLGDFGLEKNITYIYNKSKNFIEVHDDIDLLPKLKSMIGEDFVDFRIMGNEILAATKSGDFYCLETKSFETKWKIELGQSITSISLDGDISIAAVSSSLKRSALYFVDKKGEIAGSIKFRQPICSAPIVYENLYFVGSGKNLYCINRERKEILWIFEAGGVIMASPVASDAFAYFLSGDGCIRCLTFDGMLVWKRHIGAGPDSAICVHSGSIFVRSDLGIIFSLDKRSGRLNWFYEAKNRVNDFEIIGENLALGCENGFLAFLNLATGDIEDNIKMSSGDIMKINGKLKVKLKDGRSYALKY